VGGEPDLQVGIALQQSSADQVKHRDQGVLAAETELEAFDQAVAAGLGQLGCYQRNFGGNLP
jgi:hypothetical protein